MQDQVIDTVVPSGRWAFDDAVTDSFENMLSRSIPEYEVMRRAVFDLACKYRQENTDIVDLGCSRGDAVAPLVDRFGAHNRWTLVEISPSMLAIARERYACHITAGTMRVLSTDLRQAYPYVRASVTLSILTLQFVPIEYRQRILRDIYKSTVPGGALLIVEKVLGSSAELDETMIDLYYSLKRENGYTTDAIDRKRLSLEGVLVPITARFNETLIASAGFAQVDCFWRWMNFAAWIAVKE